MELKELIEQRNSLGKCPCCRQNIKDRKITLYGSLIADFYKVYRWCGKKRRHEFQRKEINHLLSRNSHARFGDLIWFGGMVYKNGKSNFGINMKRTKAFFHNKAKIPGQVVINQLTNKIETRTYIDLSKVKQLSALINKDGLYDHEREIYT